VTGERLRDLGEWKLWRRLFPYLDGEGGCVLVGPGDDAAVLAPPAGRALVLTADAMVAGVHFDFALMTPDDVGWRLAAANLSDLAAMGATPLAAVVTAAAAGDTPAAVLEGVYAGARELARATGLLLVGGDSVGTPGPLTLTMAALGTVDATRVLRRDGAGPGEAVVLSGEMALSGAGYDVLTRRGEVAEGDVAYAALRRYRRPTPRLALGAALAAGGLATACIDTSDSVAESLTLLATASGIGITVDAAALPVARAAREAAASRGEEAVRYALAAGEDFELLFTVKPDRLAAALEAARAAGVTARAIGETTSRGGPVLLRTADGAEPLPPEGFRHF
jgi:thiamine-monophosphate kinase